MFKTPGQFLCVVRLYLLSAVLSCASSYADSLQITLQFNDQPQSVEGAVVWLRPATELESSLNQKTTQAPVHVIEQKGRQFSPYISVAQLGSNIQFPNRDNTAHHVYSFSEPLSFELPLYKQRTPAPLSLEKTGLIALGCNIHDWMIAYLVVVDSPYFGQIEQSDVSFNELPIDEYTLMLWHPDINNGKALEQKFEYQGQQHHTIELPHKVVSKPQPNAPSKRLDEDEDY